MSATATVEAPHDHADLIASFGVCPVCEVAPLEAPPLVDPALLDGQLGRVYEALSRGGWWTLAELAATTEDPEASVSARIRDLRQPHRGGYQVQRRRRRPGVWEYRLSA